MQLDLAPSYHTDGKKKKKSPFGKHVELEFRKC